MKIVRVCDITYKDEISLFNGFILVRGYKDSIFIISGVIDGKKVFKQCESLKDCKKEIKKILK